jgi:hypothetical protein
MVQSGGGRSLSKTFLELEYPHLGLIVIIGLNKIKIDVSGLFTIPIIYIIIFSIEIHNLQVCR